MHDDNINGLWPLIANMVCCNLAIVKAKLTNIMSYLLPSKAMHQRVL